MGSQSPRGSYPVHTIKADGGPHVCLLFAFRYQPIATPHAASELHSRDDPDFKGIARPNILRTGIQRPDQFLTASSAAQGRRSERQRYGEQRSARASEHHGEQRSARASVRTPALPRAAQREGAFPPAPGWWGGGAAGWRGAGVRGRGPPRPRPPGGGVGNGGGGAARGRPSKRQRYGEQRSARAWE